MQNVSPSVFTTLPLTSQKSKIIWRNSFKVFTSLALLFQSGFSRIRITTSRLTTTVPLGKEDIFLLSATDLGNDSNKMVIPKFDMFVIARRGEREKVTLADILVIWLMNQIPSKQPLICLFSDSCLQNVFRLQM